MRTVITPAFNPSTPYGVLYGSIVEGEDFRKMIPCCCKRMAEAVRHEYYSHGNVEVVDLRPVPTKGAFSGWRVAPSGDAHKCDYAYQNFHYAD